MKKVSSEWIKEYNIKILDPDGWDRKNYDYSFNKEKITRKEFERRLVFSTIKGSLLDLINMNLRLRSGQEMQQEACKGKTIVEVLNHG